MLSFVLRILFANVVSDGPESQCAAYVTDNPGYKLLNVMYFISRTLRRVRLAAEVIFSLLLSVL